MDNECCLWFWQMNIEQYHVKVWKQNCFLAMNSCIWVTTNWSESLHSDNPSRTVWSAVFMYFSNGNTFSLTRCCTESGTWLFIIMLGKCAKNFLMKKMLTAYLAVFCYVVKISDSWFVLNVDTCVTFCNAAGPDSKQQRTVEFSCIYLYHNFPNTEVIRSVQL